MALLRKTAINQPDFIYTMNVTKSSILGQINCIHIGNIKEYDKDTNTCTVEINYLRQHGEDRIIEYPPLIDIPLMVLGGGNGELTFPSPVGEDCILLINDRDFDLWFESGQKTTPNTPRLHDISDAIALVGIRNILNPLTDYDETATTLRNKDSKITINETEMTLNSADEEGNQASIISLSDKIEIGNVEQSLATIMQDFLTACAGITVNTSTGALNSGSVSAFNSIKSRLGELLQ